MTLKFYAPQTVRIYVSIPGSGSNLYCNQGSRAHSCVILAYSSVLYLRTAERHCTRTQYRVSTCTEVRRYCNCWSCSTGNVYCTRTYDQERYTLVARTVARTWPENGIDSQCIHITVHDEGARSNNLIAHNHLFSKIATLLPVSLSLPPVSSLESPQS